MGYVIEEVKGIEINGKVYPCDPGDYQMMHGIMYYFPEIMQKLQDGKDLEAKLKATLARGADSSMDEVERLRDETDKVFRDVIDSGVEFIEGTLGVDEYKELFGGKRENMMQLVNLCAYIYEWANADRADVVAGYLAEPQNREQRRAAKKAAPKKTTTKKPVKGAAKDATGSASE